MHSRRGALEALYRKFPDFECAPACGKCCGPVFFSKEERQAVGLKENFPRNPETGMCRFLGADRECTIYEQRPLICRQFGTHGRMSCPVGRGPETMLPDAQADALHMAYQRLFPPTEADAKLMIDVLGDELPKGAA